jgi:hypothetical protein
MSSIQQHIVHVLQARPGTTGDLSTSGFLTHRPAYGKQSVVRCRALRNLR